MKYVLLAILCITFACADAQSAAKDKIPPFTISRTNGKQFAYTQLANDKPVVLIYFAPDCDHCLTLMKSVFRHWSAFHSFQVIMITFKPLNELAQFEKDFKLKMYPSIISGTEGSSFFIRYFYNLTSTPFFALFDRDKKLVYSNPKLLSVDSTLPELKRVTKH